MNEEDKPKPANESATASVMKPQRNASNYPEDWGDQVVRTLNHNVMAEMNEPQIEMASVEKSPSETNKVLDNKTSFYRSNEVFIKTLRDIAASAKDHEYCDHMNDIADRHDALGVRRKKYDKPK